MEMLGLPRLLWSRCIGPEVVSGKTKALLVSLSIWLSQAFSFNQQRGCAILVSLFFSFCTQPCVALQQVVTRAVVLKSGLVKRLHHLYNRHLCKVTS